MRRETALSLGLRLLGISLMVFPILIALAIHDWDLMAAVFDRRGLNEITGPLSGVVGENAVGYLQPEDARVEIDRATNSVRVSLPLPPLPFSVTITEIEFSASVGGVPVDLRMEEDDVEAVAGEVTIVHLVGNIGLLPADNTLRLSEGSITFEKLGVVVTLSVVARSGEAA
jgi:hypothetical protein